MTVKTLPLGMMQTNCYILYDESTNEAIVVDPACDFEAIKKCIEDLSLNVCYIIITHAHFDHIEALDELHEFTGAKICIGKPDSESLFDSSMNLSSAFGATSPSSKAELLLLDGDELSVSGNILKIISTPGHTRGGICILTDGILISGDTLFSESIGRTDFPGGNTATLIDSIKTKLFTLPDSTIVYPGHGPSTTIGHEKSNNPFIW